MAEYIDKSAVIAMIDEFVILCKEYGFPVDIFDMEMLKKRTEQIPAADVAQVVRCKDCKYLGIIDSDYGLYCCKRSGDETGLDDFCSCAKREEQNNG